MSQGKFFILVKQKSKWIWLFLTKQFSKPYLKYTPGNFTFLHNWIYIMVSKLSRLWANFSFKEIRMQSLYVMCPGCNTCRCQNQCKELNLSCLKLSALLLSSYLRDRPPCMWLCSRKLTKSPSLYPSTWYILSMTTSKWKVGIHTKLGENCGCSLDCRVKGILHAETAVWPSWPSLYQRSEQQDWWTVILPC